MELCVVVEEVAVRCEKPSACHPCREVAIAAVAEKAANVAVYVVVVDVEASFAGLGWAKGAVTVLGCEEGCVPFVVDA